MLRQAGAVARHVNGSMTTDMTLLRGGAASDPFVDYERASQLAVRRIEDGALQQAGDELCLASLRTTNS